MSAESLGTREIPVRPTYLPRAVSVQNGMLLRVRLLCTHPPTEKGLRTVELNIAAAAAVTGQTPQPPRLSVLYSDGGHDECVPHAWVMDGCQCGRACDTKIENSSVRECVYNADDCDHHRLQFNSCCYF